MGSTVRLLRDCGKGALMPREIFSLFFGYCLFTLMVFAFWVSILKALIITTGPFQCGALHLVKLLRFFLLFWKVLVELEPGSIPQCTILMIFVHGSGGY